jgi:hypothetical protein
MHLQLTNARPWTNDAVASAVRSPVVVHGRGGARHADCQESAQNLPEHPHEASFPRKPRVEEEFDPHPQFTAPNPAFGVLEKRRNIAGKPVPAGKEQSDAAGVVRPES